MTRNRSETTTREDDLHEMASDVSAALSRARRLNLPTSAYILSMVQVEVSQALKASANVREDDAAR